jgi:hypothetical protein
VTTLNKVLLATLVAQSALALVTRWPDSGPAEPRDLLEVKVEDIQFIRITGRSARDEKPEPPVELVREGSGWVIKSKDNYPVAEAMITPLLEAMGKLKAQTPIGEQKTTHVSLEVADDSFLRKLEVETKDGTKRTLYIGAGQGKSAAVRVEGEDEVYSVLGVTAWNIADTANRYFERDILVVDPASLSEVTVQRPLVPPITFRKAPEGTWTLDGLAPGEALDQGETTTFLSKLTNVRMADPAAPQAKPEMGLDGPEATVVRWTGEQEGQSVSGSYRISPVIPDKLNRHYLQVDGKPWVFEVVKAGVEHALTKDPKALLQGAKPAGGPPGMQHGMPPGGPGPHGGAPPGHGKAPGHP